MYLGAWLVYPAGRLVCWLELLSPVIGFPLYFLGLRHGLKVFSFFGNYFSTMGIRCPRFSSVGRRAATPTNQTK